MTNEEVAVKLEAHDHEIGSLKHRMRDVEELTEEMHSIATTTALLAQTMERTNQDMGEIKDTLKELTAAPGKKWDKFKWAFLVAVIGFGVTTIGTVVVALFKLSNGGN